MHRLIEIATAEIGTKEIEGTAHNPRIVQYSQEVGFPFRDDETPWCSIFLNWVAFKAGYLRSKSGTAFSWREIGDAVTDPQEGDVILLGKNGSLNEIYHVGIFTGFTPDRKFVLCLGGNQSNSVSISKMRIEDVAGYRRLRPDHSAPPPKYEPPKPQEETPKIDPVVPDNKPVSEVINIENVELKIPRLKLKLGDQGKEVMQLQKCLKKAGFDCGKIDGSFGRKTELAIMEIQKYEGLRITGKTNRNTRNALAKKLGLPQESLLDFLFDRDSDD